MVGAFLQGLLGRQPKLHRPAGGAVLAAGVFVFFVFLSPDRGQ